MGVGEGHASFQPGPGDDPRFGFVRALFVHENSLNRGLRGGSSVTCQQPYGQTASSDSGLGCFENLAAPEFPKAAQKAGVDGSVWIIAQVSPQGAIGKIETNGVSAYSEGAKMLTPPVEKAVHTTTPYIGAMREVIAVANGVRIFAPLRLDLNERAE
jgi:hypothetical protein